MRRSVAVEHACVHGGVHGPMANVRNPIRMQDPGRNRRSVVGVCADVMGEICGLMRSPSLQRRTDAAA
jgi:hypothetical protein